MLRRRYQAVLLAALVLAPALIFISPACPAEAAVYYVDRNHPAAGDANPGTEALPWATIQKAADTLVAGDTVYIKAGTYPEMVVPANSGAPGQYITYSRYGQDAAVIDAENGARTRGLDVRGRSYLRFIGLTLTGAAGGSGFYATDGSSQLILDRLTATNNRFGLRLYGNVTPVSQATIQDCVAASNTAHGIFLYKKVYDTVVGPNNLSYGNTGEASAYGLEIGTDYPGDPANGARNITVYNNEISYNGVQGIRTWNASDVVIRGNHLHHNGATGVQIEDGSRNILIEGNLSENNAQAYEYETGAWVDDSVNVIVQNNVLHSNKIGLLVTATVRCLVRNNVIYLDNRGVPHTWNTTGVGINNYSSDVMLVHNTLYQNGTSNSQRAGIAFGVSTPADRSVIKNNIVAETTAPLDFYAGVSTYASDYNLFYNTRALAVTYLGADLTWPQYLATSGQEAHTLNQDPGFENPGLRDFHLRAGSPAIDDGDFLTSTTAQGSGFVVPLADTRYFSAGVGGSGASRIVVGNNAPAVVLAVDDAGRTVTLDRARAWGAGDPVAYPYGDARPDLGAYETGVRLASPRNLRKK